MFYSWSSLNRPIPVENGQWLNPSCLFTWCWSSKRGGDRPWARLEDTCSCPRIEGSTQRLTLYGDGGDVAVRRWRIYVSVFNSIETFHLHHSRWNLLGTQQQLTSRHRCHTWGFHDLFGVHKHEITPIHFGVWWPLTEQRDWVCVCNQLFFHKQFSRRKSWKCRWTQKIQPCQQLRFF